MHPPGLLGLGRLGAPPYRVPRRACACRVRVRMARASCRLQASSTCCPLPGFAGSCRVAVAVCFVRVMVVSVGSKEGGDLGGRVGALRLPPRLLRAARLPPSYAPLLSCPPTCCHRACSSACLSPLLLSPSRLPPRLLRPFACLVLCSLPRLPSRLLLPSYLPLCLSVSSSALFASSESSSDSSSAAFSLAASSYVPLLACPPTCRIRACPTACCCPGATGSSTLPASADPALPHFAGAAAMNANSGELRRETESAQCCHAAGCCSCVCQLGRSGTQGPRYVMLTALHQLLMRMKYSGSLAHIRICSKYSHGHDVLENVVGGAMSSSEPSPFLVPCLGKGAQVVSPSGF